ncbi:hypothetical protein [Haloarcula laminariae]|uniref:hypothetical protein n=1 Tax=Haloarcula laminariae TaxID=2961577 RepID=UPI0021CA7EC1|nr:hypothetical protein [Halomicroarcula laminariae]
MAGDGAVTAPSVNIMYWEYPSCLTEFETYSSATAHEHQVFTRDDAGAVFDLSLSPTHLKVTASLSRRLRFRVRTLLR